MRKFLSCDWGTSSFRLRLVDTRKMEVLAEENSDAGIAATYSRWKELENGDPQERIGFYFQVIREHVQKMESILDASLKGVPLIVSGMASSSIGMVDLPYQELPFSVDGTDAGVAFYEVHKPFEHPLLLISGVKSENDVMRGEETQLMGFVENQETALNDSIYIFPGTHSKHVRVKDKQLTDFKTYMTGEYFELLSKKSILAAGVEKGTNLLDEAFLQSFRKGIRDALGANLLHASFLVRTNALFHKFSQQENYTYLSGLLIGTELQELLPFTTARIFLCGGTYLNPWYENALHELGAGDRLHTFPASWNDEAVIRGQYKVYKHFKSKR